MSIITQPITISGGISFEDMPPDTDADYAVQSSAQANEIAFITGVGVSGRTSITNFDTWSRNDPATYVAVGSAHKWLGGTAGSSGGTVWYCFDPGSDWSLSEQQGWAGAMSLWSAVADIQFVQTFTPATANVTLYRGTDGTSYQSSSYSYVSAGSATLGAFSPLGASISIDTRAFGGVNDFWSYHGFGVGTVVHELGHLLGLGHAGPYNGSVNAAAQQFGPFDSRLWTIMSYISPTDTTAKYYDQYSVTGTSWGGAAQSYTWMPLDILAVQQLYGPATSTPLSGGQVFGFNCNITGPLRAYFSFNFYTAPIVTLWDSGYNNTLDISGFHAPAVINLNPGTFSSCDGLTNNIAIAFDTHIDSAVGGAGNDLFIVNNAGDTIDGGAGFNTVAFSGYSSQYVITINQSHVIVNDRIAGRNGVSTLKNIQNLQFIDGTRTTLLVNLPADASFVASQPNMTVQGGGGTSKVTLEGYGSVFLGDSGTDLVTVTGGDTAVVAVDGNTTITANGGSVRVSGGIGATLLNVGNGAVTVQGGAGALTVNATGHDGSVMVFGGSGPLFFSGANAASTVMASVGRGAGIDTVFANGGGQYFGGSGSMLFVGGSGASTVVGGAGSNTLFGGTSGRDLLVAGTGPTLLVGGPASVLVGLGTNQDTLVAGAGPETLVGSADGGSDIMFASNSPVAMFAGSGNDTLVASNGVAQMFSGTGTDLFIFINGTAGCWDTIWGFKQGQDHVALFGYGTGIVPALIDSATVTDSGTSITLSDSTVITFSGISHLRAGDLFAA